MERTALTVDLPPAIQDYLRAFEARDVDRCASCYADDAVVQFQFSRYRGRDSIDAWHRERFAANLRVLRVEDVVADEEEVTVDAVVASDRLAQWHFDSGRTDTCRLPKRYGARRRLLREPQFILMDCQWRTARLDKLRAGFGAVGGPQSTAA